MLELILQSAELNLPQTIENLEALKAELTPRLEKYNNLVVTEDSIKAAKADKATLNRLKKAIDEQRISIKKQYLEPYTRLEEQCKEVVRLIDAPIQAIDRQIKVFEDAEKKEKYTALETAFKELNAPEWLSIDDVLNPKWENKTQKLETLQAEMAECCKKYSEEFDKLMEIYKDFPHKIAIEQKYKECKNFSQTSIYATTLQRNCETQQKQQKQQQPPQAIAESVQKPPENRNFEEPEQVFKLQFRVEATKSQIKALHQFLIDNQIKFN